MSAPAHNSPAHQLFERFRRDNWRFRRDDFAKKVAADPVAVVEFMQIAIAEWPPEKPFMCDLTGFLPAASFGEMVREAITALRLRPNNDAAAGIVARVSLETPRELHPYLAELFDLRPNESTYFATWPWRESADSHIDFLIRKATGTSEDDSRFAVEAMLESRTPRALAAVASWDLQRWRAHFSSVGFEARNGTFLQLYDPRVRHLCPPKPPSVANNVYNGQSHPSWHFGEIHPKRRFGGIGHRQCCACGQTNHHLVTLEARDLPANCTSQPRLVVETCLSCAGWHGGALFYAHDEEGIPTGAHFEGEVAEPQFPSGPLAELEVAVVPTESRWIWQDWGLSSGENLHRIGGHPCWVQDAEYLECPNCKRTMTFLLQLDSWLSRADGTEWLWGSGGVCYVLWCDECAVSAVFWQCT